MTKGIFLTAYGKRGYIWLAYNLAFSIKRFNPELSITLYHDEGVFNDISDEQRAVFDELIFIPDDVKWTNGKIDPAKIKVSVYDILPYDYNLFLDVDALALKDLSPIFDELIEEGGNYYTFIMGTHTIQEGNDIGDKMYWAYANDIWSHYNLPDTAVLPCTNSSFQFIKKCKESEELFEQIKENLANPIPLEKLKNQWGGGQPDELYLNIALAQKGMTAKSKNPYLFLGSGNDSRTFTQLTDDYYILSIFGGRNFTKLRYTEWYDRLLHNYHIAEGKAHAFKHHLIIGDKHANGKPTQSQKPQAPANSTMIVGGLRIDDTLKIDKSKLIQEYPHPKTGTVKVTNWFNCSYIKHKDKTYFVYRMEAKPFCVNIRIGICLLDKNLQPIKDSNVLLNVHSALKGYAANYHVEDPRLFEYQNELYLSYCDGYQMAQAKIDPENLQATESFYIRKPDLNRTEKNWTFFEYDNTLFSVYDTQNQEIYEMKGRDWVRKYKNPFPEWAYGYARGGTPPILVDEEYISFFHSSILVRLKGRNVKQYYMGCYAFESKPPFKVTRMSKIPIIAGELVSNSIPRLNNGIFVVFPSGVIRNEDSYDVSFGYNDLECRSVNVTDKFLSENMIALNEEVAV